MLNEKSALVMAGYRGSMTAFGDMTKINLIVQQALSSTGVNLNHVSPGTKDASDKEILAPLFMWGLDNPWPANILLKSGDRDFSDALHQLRMMGYNILLAHPVNVSQALVAAAKNVWLWTDLLIGGPPLDDPNLHNNSRSTTETPSSSMMEPAKSANCTQKNCIDGRVDSRNKGQQIGRARSQSSINMFRTSSDRSQEDQQLNVGSIVSSAKRNDPRNSRSNVEVLTANSTQNNCINGNADTCYCGQQNWRIRIQSSANLSKTTSDRSQEGHQPGRGSDACSSKQNDRMKQPNHSSNSTVPGSGLPESYNTNNIISTSPFPQPPISGFGSYENANLNNSISTFLFPQAPVSGFASYGNANRINSSSTSSFPQASLLGSPFPFPQASISGLWL